MASTSNITAGENQDFSKSVDEKVAGVQSPILEDGVNAKGIGGDNLAQVKSPIYLSQQELELLDTKRLCLEVASKFAFSINDVKKSYGELINLLLSTHGNQFD